MVEGVRSIWEERDWSCTVQMEFNHNFITGLGLTRQKAAYCGYRAVWKGRTKVVAGTWRTFYKQTPQTLQRLIILFINFARLTDD